MDGFSITTSVNTQFHLEAWILAVFMKSTDTGSSVINIVLCPNI